MLYEYARYKGYDVTKAADLSGFADQGSVSAFAVGPMQWAVAHELIFGVGGNAIAPQATATRAQLAAPLLRSVRLSGRRRLSFPVQGRIHPDAPLFLCYAQETLHFPDEFLNI